MNLKERNIIIYKIAYEYLVSILPEGVCESDLDGYFFVSKCGTLEKVFERFIQSAQNANRMPNTIKYEERKQEVEGLLFGFDYSKVKDLSVDELYNSFRNKFNVTTQDSKTNLWYKWSRSIIDCSKFVSEFKDFKQFDDYIEENSVDFDKKVKLIDNISEKIFNMSKALIPDALKEMGYLNFAKPDIHTIDICFELGISPDKNETNVLKALTILAQDNGITPYKADKVLWLICSGTFYNQKIKGGKHKTDFIEFAKTKLNE